MFNIRRLLINPKLDFSVLNSLTEKEVEVSTVSLTVYGWCTDSREQIIVDINFRRIAQNFGDGISLQRLQLYYHVAHNAGFV